MGTTLPEQVNKNVSLFCFDNVVGIILFIPTVDRCNEWSISLTRKAEPLVKENQSWPWVPPTGSCSKTLTWQLVTCCCRWKRSLASIQNRSTQKLYSIPLHRSSKTSQRVLLIPPLFIFHSPAALRAPQFSQDQDGQRRRRKEEWWKSEWKRAREIEECGNGGRRTHHAV